MRIKTFEKATVSEAMEAVRAEMGKDAVILEVKEGRPAKGLFAPLARSVVTVVAATDLTRPEEAALLAKDAKKTAAPLDQPTRLPTVVRGTDTPASARPTKQKTASTQGDKREPIVGAPEIAHSGKSLFHQYVKALYTTPLAPPSTPVSPTLSPTLSPLRAARVEEVEEAPPRDTTPAQVPLPQSERISYRKQLAVETPAEQPVCLEKPQLAGRGLLKELYHKVLATGLDAETASHLFGLLVKKLEGDALTEEVVKAYLRGLIREWVARFAAPSFITNPEKAVALVGPTGVGKTTTLIKIASRLCQAKKKVRLATMDTYRVGAVEQLRAYAQIMGLPVRVISSSEALQALWAERQAEEYLLMDTAGRSPFHPVHLQHLAMLAEVPMEVHLTLAATTRESDLNDTLASFSRVIPIDRLLFTKLDETPRRGSLFSVIRKGGKIGRGEMKPSYFTMGQRVPEDIEEATPDRIAEDVVPSL